MKNGVHPYSTVLRLLEQRQDTLKMFRWPDCLRNLSLCLFFGCCLIRPCVSVCVQYIGVSRNVVSPPGWVGVWTRLHSYDSQLSASEPSTAARSEPEPEPATTPAHLPSIPCSSPARRQPHGLSRAHRAAHAGSRRPRLPQDLPGPGLQVWLRALTTEFKKIYIYTYINSHQN